MSFDWISLGELFGERGKLIGATIALLIAIVTLAVWIFRHYHTTMLEQLIRQRVEEVQKQKEFYEKGTAALKQAEAALELQRTNLETRERKLDAVRAAFRGKEHELWRLHQARKPRDYDARMRSLARSPVIMVSNLKGGVGKTTLTANLAAYFSGKGKRVLMIDVDYQGSLSNMMLSADQSDLVSPGIKTLLSPAANNRTLHNAAHRFNNVLKGSLIIPARYDFAVVENEIMIDYLLQEDKDEDGRYRLAGLLLDQTAQFDVALIDAPPRLTAGAINAFCASTHLLVPTVYDRLSAEAVGTFLNGARVLKNALNPEIDLLGIVGMLTQEQGSLVTREQNAKLTASEEVATAWSPNHHFFNRHIPRRAAISQAAGHDIAYNTDVTVKGFFDELGDEISSRLDWERSATRRDGTLSMSKGFARDLDGQGVPLS